MFCFIRREKIELGTGWQGVCTAPYLLLTTLFDFTVAVAALAATAAAADDPG
jgi:hypothetical protein